MTPQELSHGMAMALVETMAERDQLAAQCVQLGQQCSSVVSERDALNTELALAKQQIGFLDGDRERFLAQVKVLGIDVELFLTEAAALNMEALNGEAQ